MSEYLYDIKEVITRDANARAIYELGRRHATEDAIRKQTDAVTLAIERAAKTLAAAIVTHKSNLYEKDAAHAAELLWNATAKEQEQ